MKPPEIVLLNISNLLKKSPETIINADLCGYEQLREFM